MKKLIVILALALAACGPPTPPNSYCLKSHTDLTLIPIPVMVNNTVTIQMQIIPEDVCDEAHYLTPEEKQQWLKEHQ